MSTVFIGVGSNMGDPKTKVLLAFKALEEHDEINLVSVSSLYLTEPFGCNDEQEDYINAVVEATTTLLPNDLLDVTQGIEADFGRIREERYGPRTLDLDLLLYGTKTVDTDRLQIPHPEMTNRRFVLVPLLEIAPNVEIPNAGFAKDLLASCPSAKCEKIEESQ